MKIFWQIPAITLITVCIALGFNQVRSNTLPLLCPWSVAEPDETFSEDVPTVSVEEAAVMFSHKAVFIDARPEMYYNEGHIKGALNIPWHDVEDAFFEVMGDTPLDTSIITYCDGATCDLCDKLAVFMCDLGFSQVSALANGWTVWNQHRLPIEFGDVNAR